GWWRGRGGECSHSRAPGGRDPDRCPQRPDGPGHFVGSLSRGLAVLVSPRRSPLERGRRVRLTVQRPFRLSANHFQMSLPAPWALQLEKKLADFDFVHEIGQSAVASGTSHLRLENARHPVPLPAVRRLCETGRVTVGRGSPDLQSIEGWIYLYRS